MSQNDMTIADQTFPSFRSDLNLALKALASASSGSSEPSTIFAQQLWVDTNATPWILKMRNGANDAWIAIGRIDDGDDSFSIDADNVDITDSGGFYSGTEVEASLQEVGVITAALAATYTAIGKIAGFNTQTGATYTAALSDVGKVVRMNRGTSNTLTIPTNAAVAFPSNSWFSILQIGAGTTTVTGDTAVTVNGVSAGGVASPAKYTFITALKVATDEWYLNVTGVA